MFSTHEFVIEFEAGRARPVKGKLLDRMLRDFTECAGQAGITRGRIFGERGPGYIRLVFSKDIPPAAHQQFRNIWSQYAP